MEKELEKKLKKEEEPETKQQAKKQPEDLKQQELSPTWAQECIEDIDDWIESQGIYLRQ